MIPDLLVYLAIDFIFQSRPFYRGLNCVCYVLTLTIFCIPWLSIFDDIGLHFISTFFVILSRGFCPLLGVMINTFVLALRTILFFPFPWVDACQENGSFVSDRLPFFICYFILFMSITGIRKSGQILWNWICSNPPTRSLERKCNETECVHFQLLEKLEKQLREIKNK